MPVDSLTKRYARALYAKAAERSEQGAIHARLQATEAAVRAEPRLLEMLKHPGLPVERKVRMLQQVVGGDAQGREMFERFLTLVLTKGRQHVLEAAAEAFLELWDADRNVVRAEVATVSALSSIQMQKLQQALAELTGSSVELDVSIDRSLIGGVAVRLGDRVIDGTIRGKLTRLSERLQRH